MPPIDKADGRGFSLQEAQGGMVQRWVNGLLGGIVSGRDALYLTNKQQGCLAVLRTTLSPGSQAL